VKWFVINIIIIDACLAASGAGLPAGLMVAALMVPTVTAGRVFRVT